MHFSHRDSWKRELLQLAAGWTLQRRPSVRGEREERRMANHRDGKGNETERVQWIPLRFATFNVKIGGLK